MTEIPEPASPLPWADSLQIEKGGAGTVFGKRVVDADGRGPIFEQRHMADWHHADRNRNYALWAANNAPKLAAEVARLRAALEEIAQDNHITKGSPGPLYNAGFGMGWGMAQDIAREALKEQP